MDSEERQERVQCWWTDLSISQGPVVRGRNVTTHANKQAFVRLCCVTMESRMGGEEGEQTLHTQYILTQVITLSFALPARSSSSSLTRTHFFFRLPRERGESDV